MRGQTPIWLLIEQLPEDRSEARKHTNSRRIERGGLIDDLSERPAFRQVGIVCQGITVSTESLLHCQRESVRGFFPAVPISATLRGGPWSGLGGY
jgi:hypothetical protein